MMDRRFTRFCARGFFLGFLLFLLVVILELICFATGIFCFGNCILILFLFEILE